MAGINGRSARGGPTGDEQESQGDNGCLSGWDVCICSSFWWQTCGERSIDPHKRPCASSVFEDVGESEGSLDKMSLRPRWDMLSSFPSCMCAINPEQLPNELGPGVPAACRHQHVKKSAGRDMFHIATSLATSVWSPVGSLVGGKLEKPQGVRVLRGGPMTIVYTPRCLAQPRSFLGQGRVGRPSPAWPTNEQRTT